MGFCQVQSPAMFSEQNNQQSSSLMRPWLIWGLAAAYFLFDYAARVSPSVMLPQLQQAFQVTAVGLGSLSAFFYYPYVLMQIPVGMIVDRMSIRYLLTTMAILTGVGCFIFGTAQILAMAKFGRFLIGFSAAFAFVSALKLASVWFPPSRLGLLAGLTQALGMVGAAIGELPVSFMVAAIDWRQTMMLMSLLFLVLAYLIYRIIRDHPRQTLAQYDAKNNTGLSLQESLFIVMKNPQSWWNALAIGLIYAPTAALGELWGVAFLQYGHGFNHHVAAFANSLIFVGWAIGGPIAGWLSDRLGLRKPLMMASAFCGLVLISILIYVPDISPGLAYLLLFVHGFTNIGVAISYAVATEINPRQVTGVSVAFANMASIMIGSSLQPLIGKLMDINSTMNGGLSDITLYTILDFRAALWVLPICSALAMVCIFFIRETGKKQ